MCLIENYIIHIYLYLYNGYIFLYSQCNASFKRDIYIISRCKRLSQNILHMIDIFFNSCCDFSNVSVSSVNYAKNHRFL